MRWIASLMVALLFGVGALYWQTDGFTALTAEAARRNQVAAHPRALPPVRILDEQDGAQPLAAALRADGRIAIVNFFYTRCMSLCLAQGSQMERLQRAILERGLAGRVRLLSISFDPRDGALELARYARRMNADENIWQFASIADEAQRDGLLALFGIVVIPAPLGEFEHNAAFHLVTPDGRLARIVDMDEPGRALELAEDMSGR